METLWRDDDTSIELGEENSVIIWKMLGVPNSSEDYRNSIKVFVDLIAKHQKNNPKLHPIFDPTHMVGVAPEDVEWTSGYFNSEISKLGILKCAIIQPQSVFGDVTVKDYMDMPTISGVVSRMFPDMEKAKLWLNS